MKSLDVYIDGNHITTEDELHKFLIYKFEEDMRNINVEETNIQNDEYRGNKKKSKKKNQECKPQGPKPVCLKYMHPYKIETEVGCKQMIFGVLVDSKGRPINNPIIPPIAPNTISIIAIFCVYFSMYSIKLNNHFIIGWRNR